MSGTDRVANWLGIVPAERQPAAENLYLVTREPMVYWLQLVIAAGIAHFGLVLNSTAVVIGGMLVSPLMTPIVQLGMSFAIGNFFLAARATLRIALSVALVIALAALMTKVMPFTEVTPEILGRVQPTALDLIVALFCGMAAAFTAAASSKDSVSAAAGTAIAIALVPPLCVVGFGLGIGSPQIFWGALLLFTANLSAIILVSDLFFILNGFGSLDTNALDDAVLTPADRESWAYRTARRFKTNPERPSWLTFRLLLPVAFVGTLLFPLNEALSRVAWEVNVKKGVNAILADFENHHRVLHKVQAVNFGSVSVYLTIVGEPGTRSEIMGELQLKLAMVAGIEPTVGLDIVPSSEFMDATLKRSTEHISKQLASLKMEQTGRSKMEVICPNPEDAARGLPLAFFRAHLRDTIAGILSWLGRDDREGVWLDWSFGIGDAENTLVIHRLSDTPLSEGFRTLAGSVLLKETGIPAQIVEDRVPQTLLDTEVADAAKLPQDELRRVLGRRDMLHTERLRLLVTLRDPSKAPNARQRTAWLRMNETIRELLQNLPESNLQIDEDQNLWSIHIEVVPPAPPVTTGKTDPGTGSKADAEPEGAETKEESAPVQPDNIIPKSTALEETAPEQKAGRKTAAESPSPPG